MTVSPFLLSLEVGLAGALGAVARYLFGRITLQHINTSFPLGTFLINITGAFFIGLVSGLTAKHTISETTQLVLATGFLGGYTTFSTLNWETMQLVKHGNAAQSLLYYCGTFTLGIGAVIPGILIGHLL